MKNLIPGLLFCSLLTGAACNKTSQTAMPDTSLENDQFATKVETPFSKTDPSANAANKTTEKYNTFYGPVSQMGNGRIRTWVNISHSGKALAIGVALTDDALGGLPTDPMDFANSTFYLPFHQKAKEVTAFDHAGINWNVHGHEPAHVYDQPHFDFHFYKIPLSEQLAIPPFEVNPTGFDALPPDEYIPVNYLRGPGGVPQMGTHWIDLLSPELGGVLFTHTMIYGSYNGKVTFLEPMITLAVLQSGETIHQPFRQPEKFDPVHKYYPTRYNIWKEGRIHYVSLDEMVWR